MSNKDKTARARPAPNPHAIAIWDDVQLLVLDCLEVMRVSHPSSMLFAISTSQLCSDLHSLQNAYCVASQTSLRKRYRSTTNFQR